MKTRSIFFFVCVLILSGSVNRQVVDEIRDWPLDISPSFVTWSSDSQWYTFVDVTLDLGTAEEESTPLPPGLGPTLPRPAWGAYSPSTKRYIVDYTWWLQPELSSAEAAVIDTDDIIQTSSDGSRLLFLAPSDRFSTLQLHDRRTGELIDTMITSFYSMTSQAIVVAWASDSPAFAVLVPSFADSSDMYYFPDPSIDDTLWIEVDTLQLNAEPPYRTIFNYEDILFDISDEGNAILLTASREAENYQYESALIVWYPLSEEQSYVIPSVDAYRVVSAAFVPNSNEQILIVQVDGTIYLYDALSGTTRTITTVPTIWQSAISAAAPRFSPDGQWLAYFSGRPDPDEGLNFLDVTSLLEQQNTGASLVLQATCSLDPGNVRTWLVRNTNPDPVNFTWKVIDTAQYGSRTVPNGTEDNPGEVTFETQTVSDSPNTVRIFVNGIEQDQQDSLSDYCS